MEALDTLLTAAIVVAAFVAASHVFVAAFSILFQ